MEKNSAEPGPQTLCQRCQIKPASVHFTKVVNGDKSERYLCEDCAKEEGAYHFMLAPQFTVQHVLGGLIGQVGAPTYTEAHTKRCSHCGYTYQRFAETGRFGCDDCYHTFATELEPLIRRLHGSLEHHGKIPRRGGAYLIQQQQLSELRRRMQEAVAHEAFEEAARIRDQIRQLEESVQERRERPGEDDGTQI